MAAKFRKFNSVGELLTFLNGEVIASSSTGSGTVGTTTFTDATGTPFADVVAGDKLEISGDGCYTVASVTDPNTVELVEPLSTTYTADAKWRVTRGSFALADFDYFSVYGQEGSHFVGIWNDTTF